MPSFWQLRCASYIVKAGGIIAYPTEAVFGLGCDPYNQRALTKILALKGRPINKGVILIAADFNQIIPFIAPLSNLPAARITQIKASWPGPVTWVLPARNDIPHWLTGGRHTIAVRITAHPSAVALCRICKTALVSTSANSTNHLPLRNSLQLRRWLQRLPGNNENHINYILPGYCGPTSRPSRIIDATSGLTLRH
ncbi:hypothetical protein TI03_02150 [Achromatium sp. WMS1]|nr:hypothetical protein TI03_02150 [Achromatium sp. WMS1]